MLRVNGGLTRCWRTFLPFYFSSNDFLFYKFANYKFRVASRRRGRTALRMYSLMFCGKIALPKLCTIDHFYIFAPSTDKLLEEYMRAMCIHTLYRLMTLNTSLNVCSSSFQIRPISSNVLECSASIGFSSLTLSYTMSLLPTRWNEFFDFTQGLVQ